MRKILSTFMKIFLDTKKLYKNSEENNIQKLQENFWRIFMKILEKFQGTFS